MGANPADLASPSRLYGFQATLETGNSKDHSPVELKFDPEGANLVLSQTSFQGIHMPAIDIDGIPVRVVESSTPGNYHLFIDKPMEWSKYVALLEAMVDAGIVEERYLEHSLRRGFTALRTGKRANPRPDPQGSDYPTAA